MRAKQQRLILFSLIFMTGCKTTASALFEAAPGSRINLSVTTDQPLLSVVEWHYVLKARSQRPACFEGDPAAQGMDAARMFVELVKPTGTASEGYHLAPAASVSATYCLAQLHPSNELRVRLEDPAAPLGFRSGIIHILAKGGPSKARLLCWPHAKDPNRLTCDDAAVALPEEGEGNLALAIGVK